MKRILVLGLMIAAQSAFATDPQFGAIRIEATQSVTHAFVSAKSQGSDASKVSANEWNAAHTAPVILIASVPTGFVWPAQPAAVTEFCGGSTEYRWRANLTSTSTIRLTAQVISAGAATAALRLQYTTDTTGATGWDYLDSVSGPSVSINATGVTVSASVSVASAAKADVLLRLVGINGDGAGGTCYSTLKASTSTLADAATALAANGANCSAGSAPLGVDASGAVEGCFAVPSGTGTVSGTNTGDQTTITGNAGTATALADNGANCSAGNYPLGVDASGAAESCTAVPAGVTSGAASSGCTAYSLVYIDSGGNLACAQAPQNGSSTSVGTGTITWASTMSGSSTSSNLLNITGTLPTTSTQIPAAFRMDITGAGSSNPTGNMVTAAYINFASGYSGSGQPVALYVNNANVATGGSRMVGIKVHASGTNSVNTLGIDADTSSNTGASTNQWGGRFIAGSGITANGGTLIGVQGYATSSGGTSPLIGGLFSVGSVPAPSSSVGLAAGNGSSPSNIFQAIDATTPVLTVADDGATTITTVGASTVPLTVSNSTSTGAIFIAKDNTTTTFTLPDGGGMILGTATRPTCDSTYRGAFWYVAGGAGVADTVAVCAKDGADAYAWRTIY